MSLNWDDMRYFLAAARKNSFVAAAGTLMVTHTTVARRISSLEDVLQTQLFYRSEKGCMLTPAGEKLLGFADQMESTVLNLREDVSGGDHLLSGAVRIGAPDGLGNCYLASCIGKLQEIHPSLEIELIAVPMYYSLSKREIDILITVRKPTVGNVICKKLTSYNLGVFGSQEYLKKHGEIHSREDLKDHKIIGYIDDLLFDRDLQFMEEIYPGLSPQLKSTTVVAQMEAVASGAGVGVIPFFMANREKRLRSVLPEITIARDYWLQVNPESRKIARVRVAIDFLSQQIGLDKNLFITRPVGDKRK